MALRKIEVRIQAGNVLGHGHKELSASVGSRNVFASSNARKRSLSLSQSARHLEVKPPMRGRRYNNEIINARCNLVGEPADVVRTTENDVC
jgi:hypothetical protein